MRIAWFGHVPSVRGNGLVTYSREMVRGLQSRGQQVFFFCHDNIKKDARGNTQNISLDSINILDRLSFSLPSARERIERTLDDEHIDVAHVSISFSQLDGALPAICQMRGIPIVATLHYPHGPTGTFWGAAARALYRMNSRAFKKYDAVIVFSKLQQEILVQDGVPRERIRVIPNGVNIETFSPGPSDYKETIGAVFLVTFLGRVDSEKNVGHLIRAFRKLNLPLDHKLAIVGNGNELRRLRNNFEHDPRIIFHGYVGESAERRRILRATDIFVLPSAIEGLSLALLEAMATGCAVIATDVGAGAEVLQDAGLVVDSRALDEQLTLALQKLIDHPQLRREFGEHARQRAIERYSLEKNIDRVVTLYRELTGKAD